MGFWETVERLMGKTSVATFVAGGSILYGLYILGQASNTEGVMFIVGGAIGYLFGQRTGGGQ